MLRDFTWTEKYEEAMSDEYPPYIIYMSYERLHGEEQFRSKRYLWEMTPSCAKLRLKSLPQKRNF